MKKLLSILIIALLGITFAQDFPRTIIDGQGRELTFNAPPERVLPYYNGSYGHLATLAFSLDDVDTSGGIAPVYLPSRPSTLAGVQDELRNVAAIFGVEDKAEEVITTFNDRVTAYATVVEASADMTILKLAMVDDGQFSVATTGDPVCQMLDIVATCEWQDPTGGSGWGYRTSIEGVLALDPDLIILNNWADDDPEAAKAAQADDP